MRRIRLLAVAALVAAPLALAAPSNAQTTAVVGVDLTLRTGPDTMYPPVLILPAGAAVTVFGCVDGWLWCDVAWGENRGWVAGSYLAVTYHERRVPFVEYAPRVGFPIVMFSLGNYWDRHYRARPWYSRRGHWEGWDHKGKRWRDRRDRRDRDWDRARRRDDGGKHFRQHDDGRDKRNWQRDGDRDKRGKQSWDPDRGKAKTRRHDDDGNRRFQGRKDDGNRKAKGRDDDKGKARRAADDRNGKKKKGDGKKKDKGKDRDRD